MNIAELNARSRAFHAGRTDATVQQMADALVHKQVMAEIADEQKRRLPIAVQRPIEVIAEGLAGFRDAVVAREMAREHDQQQKEYERGARDARCALAAKGGAASKADALTKYIIDGVAQNPSIGVADLQRDLRGSARMKGFEWLDEVTETEIHLASGRTIPLSALKDRLSRAKKGRERRRAKRLARFRLSMPRPLCGLKAKNSGPTTQG